MGFDANGNLWATTGGGPLVEIDPTTGQITNRFGNGITLGLAIDPNSTKIYVATGTGIAIFDTKTDLFTPFSSTRVDGLALNPADGSLWGVTYPFNGQVVEFDAHGNPTVMLADTGADGLAFGQPGTALAGLLFVSHDAGVALTMVDLATMQTVDVASTGTRGDFLHASPDGRLYVTQSNEVDVFAPVLPPKVIAVTPEPGATLVPVVNSATVTFSEDMLVAASNPAAVTNPANYTLVDQTTGLATSITAALYDPADRTVQLVFKHAPPARLLLADRARGSRATPYARWRRTSPMALACCRT